MELINNSTDMIYVKDSRGHYMFANQKFLDMIALPIEAILDKNDEDVFRSTGDTKTIKAHEMIMEDISFSKFQEVFKTSGGERILETTSFWLTDDKNEIYAVCYVSKDVTELKAIEKKMKLKEDYHRSLIENTQGVVYRCALSHDWMMFFMSDYTLNLTGYPKEDFIMNNVRTYESIIHPADKGSVLDAVHRSVRKKQPYTLIYRIVHKNGNVKWIYDRGRGFFTEKGEAKYLDGVMVDITQQKQMSELLELKNEKLLKEIDRRKAFETELTSLNQDLEKRVEGRTKDLKDTNELLNNKLKELETAQNNLVESKKVAAIGALISSISNEINSPLGSSLMMATYLQKTVRDFTKLVESSAASKKDFRGFHDEVDKSVDIMIESLEKGTEIMEQFKMLAADKVMPELQLFNMHYFLTTVLGTVKKELESRDVKITLNCEDELMVYTKPSVIYQILNKLMLSSRAHRFNSKLSGAIDITIAKEENSLIMYYSDAEDHDAKTFDFSNEISAEALCENDEEYCELSEIYRLVDNALNGTIRHKGNVYEGISIFVKVPLERN